jgi:beta-glucosidase
VIYGRHRASSAVVQHTHIHPAHTQIDALLAKGITPLVTLFHWDMPLPLEDKYGGFTASKQDQPAFLADFVNYARVCFEAFGDRVKNWITINEVGRARRRVSSPRRQQKSRGAADPQPQIYSLLTGAFLHRETYDPDITRWM